MCGAFFIRLESNQLCETGFKNILVSPFSYLRYLRAFKNIYSRNLTKYEDEKALNELGIAKFLALKSQVNNITSAIRTYVVTFFLLCIPACRFRERH